MLLLVITFEWTQWQKVADDPFCLPGYPCCSDYYKYEDLEGYDFLVLLVSQVLLS